MRKLVLVVVAILTSMISSQEMKAQVKALEFFNGNGVKECKIYLPQAGNSYFEDFQATTLTVEMWVNVAAEQEAQGGVLIATKNKWVGDLSENSEKRGGWEFLLQPGGWVRASYGYGEDGVGVQWMNAKTVAGEWAHLAFVLNGTNCKIYKNGELSDEKNFAMLFTKSIGDLMIGKNPTWDEGEYFNGQVTDIRIWNVARTQSEIQADNGIYFTKKKEGLVANWTAQEGSGTVLGNLMHSTRNKAQVILTNSLDVTGIRWIDSTCPVVAEGSTDVSLVNINDPVVSREYYSLQGSKIAFLEAGNFYIVKSVRASGRSESTKIFNK